MKTMFRVLMVLVSFLFFGGAFGAEKNACTDAWKAYGKKVALEKSPTRYEYVFKNKKAPSLIVVRVYEVIDPAVAYEAFEKDGKCIIMDRDRTSSREVFSVVANGLESSGYRLIEVRNKDQADLDDPSMNTIDIR